MFYIFTFKYPLAIKSAKTKAFFCYEEQTRDKIFPINTY